MYRCLFCPFIFKNASTDCPFDLYDTAHADGFVSVGHGGHISGFDERCGSFLALF